MSGSTVNSEAEIKKDVEGMRSEVDWIKVILIR